jgi:hypothetical protein
MKLHYAFTCVIFAICAAPAFAETLAVRAPGIDVASATATAAGTKVELAGKVDGQAVAFDDLIAGERYDVALAPRAGPTIRLIDLSWHAPDAPATTDAPLADDDKAAILDIVAQVKAFTNRNAILHLVGNADRATALVELIRDTPWHDRKGDEVLWRVEVWHFENQAGGWAKAQQQNRIIERRRVESPAALDAIRAGIRWVGIESGLLIQRGQNATIDVPAAR